MLACLLRVANSTSLLPRPELLDGSDEVGAVRLAHKVEHAGGSIRSELPVESASEGLLVGLAALKGSIGHGLSGTGTAQVGFGGGCGALHPLVPKLLDVCVQGSRAWGLHLRRGWLQRSRGTGRIGAGRQTCEEGDGRNSQGSHPGIEPRCVLTVKLTSAALSLIVTLT